jgi:hypothetical protein
MALEPSNPKSYSGMRAIEGKVDFERIQFALLGLPNGRVSDSHKCSTRNVALRNLGELEMQRLVESLCDGDGACSSAVVEHLSQEGKKEWSVAEVYAAVRTVMQKKERGTLRADAA